RFKLVIKKTFRWHNRIVHNHGKSEIQFRNKQIRTLTSNWFGYLILLNVVQLVHAIINCNWYLIWHYL
uniref:Uncharacterized protein n=1 Tax=Ciona savignyi TaxID=51511 RepID=H2Z1S0_CIOSA